MKAKTAVALRLDCGLPLDALKIRVMETPSGQLAVLNCTSVLETSYGFVRLVLQEEGSPELALTVPPHAIAWMVQAEQSSALGFLAGAG